MIVLGYIQVLDDLVSNQIAAGEVVERPASVVKELIENAMDAEAQRIIIRITGGGMTSIEVVDDGFGIAADEVELAFIRHATSKLRSIDDLRKIHSLGFRGEALPSISSVSNVVVRTREKDQESGVQLQFRGGLLTKREEVGCPVGTRMMITDLFYNTPARLKFVRSLQTEAGHVVDVVSRAAAARPDLAFVVESDGKGNLETPGDGMLTSVFASVYGVPTTKSALAISLDHPDYVIRGLISLPEYSKSTRNAMWFSINGRPIRSLALGNAILVGYYTTLPKGRYPIVMINMTMDPNLVDVNVHPSKLEVRFSEEKDVRDLLVRAVKEALQAGFAPPFVNTPESRVWEETPVREIVSSYPETAFKAPSYVHAPAISSAKQVSDAQLAMVLQEPAATVVEPRGPQITAQAIRKGQIRAIAQALQMYIVAQDGESVYLIDQHAAHERVLYEKFRQSFQERGKFSLPLLVAITIDLRAHEVQILGKYADKAQAFGLVYERFGDTSIVVREIPHIWEGLDVHRLVNDFLTDLLEERDLDSMLKMEDRLIMRACKAAIKANQTLSIMEMNALLDALSTLENPFTCPHGRPTAVILSRQQLEREFKRSL